MSQTLRDALALFEHFAESDVTLPSKAHTEILCRGYAAASRGWRLVATGDGDETEIVATLKEATIQLHGNERRRRGPRLTLLQGPEDGMVLRRFFERDPLSLTLRHFVEVAFDAGEIDPKKDHTIDVHVNRLQRFIDRG